MHSKGLTQQQAQQLLRQVGPNTTQAEYPSVWKLIARQLASPLALMLFAASALSMVAGARLDAVVILTIFGANALLSFVQEWNAEQTTKRLNRRLSPLVDVIRDGEPTVVVARDIVPGDVVLLEAGDIVPADAVITHMSDVMLDESALTGESAPVSKQIGDAVFSGTSLLQGEATVLVEKTGEHTRSAQIAKLAIEEEAPSSFEITVGNISTLIAQITGVVLLMVFVAQLYLRPELAITERLLFFVALAILMVPEALPAVVTITMSRGAMRLAKKSVLVRKLSSIEELGHIQVLCVDKTGTITEGVMRVSTVLGDAQELEKYIAPTIGKEVPHTVSGMAYDRALQEWYKDSVDTARSAVLDVVPFDPIRRRSSRMVKIGAKKFLVVQGAPEEMLKVATCTVGDKELKSAEWLEKYAELGRAGERTLAFAIKEMPHETSTISATDEQDLCWLGLIGFSDPLRVTARQAIQMAQNMNVQVKILTGDSVEVALAVAGKAGILEKHERVVSGHEFEQASYEERQALVRTGSVFARISPEQKYRIVKMLASEGKRVAFMGDGMNDAPALRTAHVGLAVSTAADVSKAAADIVLLKSDIRVIVEAMKDGREISVNVRKFLYATLVGNFGNFITASILSLSLPYLPLLPIQVLLLNFITDFPMVAVASDTVDEEETTHPHVINTRDVMKVTLVLGLLAALCIFGSFAIFHALSPDRVRTLWFTVAALVEIIAIYSIRSWRPMWQAKAPSKPFLFFTLLAVAMVIALPFTSLGQTIFHFGKPTWTELGIALAFVPFFLFAAEFVKRHLRLMRRAF